MRVAPTTRTLTLRLRLGSLPKRAKLSFSGGGARVTKVARLGRGRWKLTVRVTTGRPVRQRTLTVKVGRRTVKVVRRAARF